MGRTQLSAVKLANVTTGQRDALTAAEGDLVENTTYHTPDYYDGTAWHPIPILGDHAFSNADATFQSYDRSLRQTGTMSAIRTVSLPAANSMPKGTIIVIADQSGTVTSSNFILINRAGSDLITTTGGANLTGTTITTPGGAVYLMTDGVSQWTVLVDAVTPVLRGGTGSTTTTAAMNTLSPTTTRGDLLYQGAANVVRLAIGTTGKFLRTNGTDPSWQNIAAADVSGLVGWDAEAKVATNDATETGQSLNPITGLSASLTSGTWEFLITMLCTTTGTAGTKYGLNLSANLTTLQARVDGSLTTTTFQTDALTANNTANATALLTSSGQTGLVIIRGIVVVSGASTMTVRQLKVTSGTATVKVGSVFRWHQVA